jgi:hypothetical protein
LLAVPPASADPIAQASQLPALDVYVDALAAGHAAETVCNSAWPPSKLSESGWQRAKSILVASLWGNGFPIDFVRGATTRLDAPPPAAKPDCAHPDPALAGQLGWPSSAGWVEVIEGALKGMDLTVIDQPVAPDTWTNIKGMIAKVLPEEKRLLDCVAVMYPETLPQTVHDWDQMIGGMGASLLRAGLPRDEVSATLSGAEANQLWHRVPVAGEAELRDSCRSDKAFEASLANFGFGGLKSAVEKLLPQPAADGGNG